MKFEKIWFKNFRNLKDQQLIIDNDQVLLVGENGQGKTNFLEVFYFLCYGNSFRTSNLKDVVKHGFDNFSIGASFEDFYGEKRNIVLKYVQGKKTVLLNQREIKDRKEIIYNIPCIIFSYDDMALIKGEPEFRRVFFDQTLSMYDPLYLDDLRHYKAILKQRNSAIHNNMESMLEIYDIQLAKYAINIIEQRKRVVEAFNLIFSDLYSSIANDNRQMQIVYRPSWDNMSQDEIVQSLKENHFRDLKLGYTVSGIHRDKYNLNDQYGLFVNTASTGQMRLASLVLRTAQAAFFRNKTNRDPVLLIDDVLLELDNLKRGEFLAKLGSYSQAFFTFLVDEKYFISLKSNTKIFTVKDGELVDEG